MGFSQFESLESRRKRLDPAMAAASHRALADAAGRAAHLSARALLGMQKPEGYWCGELLADSTLESDYILLQLWLRPPAGDTWQPSTWNRIQKARRSILDRQ